jgi:hypothetical protein
MRPVVMNIWRPLDFVRLRERWVHVERGFTVELESCKVSIFGLIFAGVPQTRAYCDRKVIPRIESTA